MSAKYFLFKEELQRKAIEVLLEDWETPKRTEEMLESPRLPITAKSKLNNQNGPAPQQPKSTEAVQPETRDPKPSAVPTLAPPEKRPSPRLMSASLKSMRKRPTSPFLKPTFIPCMRQVERLTPKTQPPTGIPSKCVSPQPKLLVEEQTEEMLSATAMKKSAYAFKMRKFLVKCTVPKENQEAGTLERPGTSFDNKLSDAGKALPIHAMKKGFRYMNRVHRHPNSYLAHATPKGGESLREFPISRPEMELSTYGMNPPPKPKTQMMAVSSMPKIELIGSSQQHVSLPVSPSVKNLEVQRGSLIKDLRDACMFGRANRQFGDLLGKICPVAETSAKKPVIVQLDSSISVVRKGSVLCSPAHQMASNIGSVHSMTRIHEYYSQERRLQENRSQVKL